MPSGSLFPASWGSCSRTFSIFSSPCLPVCCRASTMLIMDSTSETIKASPNLMMSFKRACCGHGSLFLAIEHGLKHQIIRHISTINNFQLKYYKNKKQFYIYQLQKIIHWLSSRYQWTGLNQAIPLVDKLLSTFGTEIQYLLDSYCRTNVTSNDSLSVTICPEQSQWVWNC